MTNALIVWGLVFLIGMLATHYLIADLWLAWIGWLIIIFVANALVDRSMKKAPRELTHMWHVVSILGVLITIAFLTETIAFDASKVMAVWFFLMGAATFAGAHQMKNPEQVFVGLLWIVTGIMLPLVFTSVPFLIGGLIFGLPPVIGGLLKK